MKKKEVKRPWGGFRQFTINEKSTVKILTIKAGRRFSLQYHNHREEFWKVLQGKAVITVGKRKFGAKPGDEFYIKKKENHRIKALDEDVKVLEVSFGKFKESDIKRLEDDFGRK